MKIEKCLTWCRGVCIVTLLLQAGPLSADTATQCVNNLASPIPIFCEVESGILWRGSKPDKVAASWLINNGVKSVINLELLHDDLQQFLAASTRPDENFSVDYYRVKTWEPLYAVAKSSADADVVQFLAVASQAQRPLYVHCRAGENRTGVMVAAYKIILEGQSSAAQVEAILSEMQSYKGFWSDATTSYIRDLVPRRDEFLRKVKAYSVGRPIQISCQQGVCNELAQAVQKMKKH